MPTHVCMCVDIDVTSILVHCQPAQMGAVPVHAPTAVRPSPTQILTSFPPLLSCPGGHETVYVACVPDKYGKVFGE